MTRFSRDFLLALLLGCACFAQSPEDRLRSKITAVRYSLLGEQARIQGTVHLSVKSGVVTRLSGHPLLAQTAVESAKAFGSIQGDTDLDVTYHFVLIDVVSVPVPITIPRGNAFARAVLRVFGRKTEKVVLEYRCQEGIPPANDFRIAGAVMEIWIYGRTRCLQTQTALMARFEQLQCGSYAGPICAPRSQTNI